MLLERSGLISLKFHGIEIKVATQPQGCAQSVQYLQCVQYLAIYQLFALMILTDSLTLIPQF